MKLLIKTIGLLAIFFVLPVQASDLQRCKAQNSYSYKACEALASRGDPDGQFGLGMLFLEGTGVKKDYQKSFDLSKRPAITACRV